jgi:hypothetical protein
MGSEVIDESLCQTAASQAGMSFATPQSWPVANGVPYGCWHFTGSSTYSFNTNTGGSAKGAWNGNVMPVCRTYWRAAGNGNEVSGGPCSCLAALQFKSGLPASLPVVQGEIVNMETQWDYVVVPNGKSTCLPSGVGCGRASFRFETFGVTPPILFELEVVAPTATDDSFYLSVDYGTDMTWHLGQHQEWTWVSSPQYFQVQAGVHVLHVKEREDGTKLRAVRFVFEEADVCGCYPSLGGWSTTAGACAAGSTTQPDEVEACEAGEAGVVADGADGSACWLPPLSRIYHYSNGFNHSVFYSFRTHLEENRDWYRFVLDRKFDLTGPFTSWFTCTVGVPCSVTLDGHRLALSNNVLLFHGSQPMFDGEACKHTDPIVVDVATACPSWDDAVFGMQCSGGTDGGPGCEDAVSSAADGLVCATILGGPIFGPYPFLTEEECRAACIEAADAAMLGGDSCCEWRTSGACTWKPFGEQAVSAILTAKSITCYAPTPPQDCERVSGSTLCEIRDDKQPVDFIDDFGWWANPVCEDNVTWPHSSNFQFPRKFRNYKRNFRQSKFPNFHQNFQD